LSEEDMKTVIYKEIVERAKKEYEKWKLKKEEEDKLLANYPWVRQLRGIVPEVYILSDKLEEKPK
jgi:DNA-binding NtrC family response regulator